MNEQTRGMIDTNNEIQVTQLMQTRYNNIDEDPVPFGRSMRILHSTLNDQHIQHLPEYIKQKVVNTQQETQGGQSNPKRGTHTNEFLELFVHNNQINHNDIQKRVSGIQNHKDIATIRAHMSEQAKETIDKREAASI